MTSLLSLGHHSPVDFAAGLAFRQFDDAAAQDDGSTSSGRLDHQCHHLQERKVGPKTFRSSRACVRKNKIELAQVSASQLSWL